MPIVFKGANSIMQLVLQGVNSILPLLLQRGKIYYSTCAPRGKLYYTTCAPTPRYPPRLLAIYLIDVVAVGTVTTETNRAGSTFPGAVRRAVTVHTSETWVGQTAVWITG